MAQAAYENAGWKGDECADFSDRSASLSPLPPRAAVVQDRTNNSNLNANLVNPSEIRLGEKEPVTERPSQAEKKKGKSKPTAVAGASTNPATSVALRTACEDNGSLDGAGEEEDGEDIVLHATDFKPPRHHHHHRRRNKKRHHSGTPNEGSESDDNGVVENDAEKAKEEEEGDGLKELFKAHKRRIVFFLWLLGLINNFHYNLIVSAASDLVSQYNMKQFVALVSFFNVFLGIIARILNTFAASRISFNIRMTLMSCVTIVGLLFVSFSSQLGRHQDVSSFVVVLFGVTCVGTAYSYGETVVLCFVQRYPPSMVGAWSSGTGISGVVASVLFVILSATGVDMVIIFLATIPLTVVYWLVFTMGLVAPQTVVYLMPAENADAVNVTSGSDNSQQQQQQQQSQDGGAKPMKPKRFVLFRGREEEMLSAARAECRANANLTLTEPKTDMVINFFGISWRSVPSAPADAPPVSATTTAAATGILYDGDADSLDPDAVPPDAAAVAEELAREEQAMSVADYYFLKEVKKETVALVKQQQETAQELKWKSWRWGGSGNVQRNDEDRRNGGDAFLSVGDGGAMDGGSGDNDEEEDSEARAREEECCCFCPFCPTGCEASAGRSCSRLGFLVPRGMQRWWRHHGPDIKQVHKAMGWLFFNLAIVYISEYAVQFMAPFSFYCTAEWKRHSPAASPAGGAASSSSSSASSSFVGSSTFAGAATAAGEVDMGKVSSPVKSPLFWLEYSYPLSQVCYQLGVFISRSSMMVCGLKIAAVGVLSIIQVINAILWLVQAKTLFISAKHHQTVQIGLAFLLFAWMLFVGLVGGASYVNVYYLILCRSQRLQKMEEDAARAVIWRRVCGIALDDSHDDNDEDDGCGKKKKYGGSGDGFDEIAMESRSPSFANPPADISLPDPPRGRCAEEQRAREATVSLDGVGSCNGPDSTTCSVVPSVFGKRLPANGDAVTVEGQVASEEEEEEEEEDNGENGAASFNGNRSRRVGVDKRKMDPSASSPFSSPSAAAAGTAAGPAVVLLDAGVVGGAAVKSGGMCDCSDEEEAVAFSPLAAASTSTALPSVAFGEDGKADATAVMKTKQKKRSTTSDEDDDDCSDPQDEQDGRQEERGKAAEAGRLFTLYHATIAEAWQRRRELSMSTGAVYAMLGICAGTIFDVILTNTTLKHNTSTTC